jgi:type I restriction-modification system DNA methylase subunit
LNHTERAYNALRLNIDAPIVFRTVFNLLAAKLLKDRDVLAHGNIDFSLPRTALQAVRNHYGQSSSIDTSQIPLSILNDISKEIGNSFSLRNISVDTLTYIYENTFVSAESRKNLGIHSTPSYVADYVMSQIPLEILQKAKWNITDPMAGHGIFLISAMRRMRDLLPDDWNGKKRHNFYIDHLRGIEIDPFSIEVARLCLMLADFPEPNGWHLKYGDAFAGNILENTMADTMILVGKPPFENIEGRSPEIPKPVELLNRALPALPALALIGLVLPRSFVDGSDYKKQREFILQNFEIIALTDLPDRIFLHSDMETTILIARKTKPQLVQNVIYREVKDSERVIFRTRHQVTRIDQVQQIYFENETRGRFIVPLLREIWEYLKYNSKFGDIADIKIGVQYESTLVKEKLNDVIRIQPFDGASPAIVKITENFKQFIAKETYYISTDNKLRRRNAWDLNWKEPKVVLPAARMSRGPWRYAAAIDIEGRIVNRDFFAVWPKLEELSVELLAALLNSPVAVAFTYAHSFQRTITKRVYQDIPIPEISNESKMIINTLVNNYLEAISLNTFEAKTILLQIDAEILKSYNLPPKLERQLLDIFHGHQRPVPFEFTGYIPPEIASWIPLHIYISDQFKKTTPQNIIKHIPIIHDAEFLHYLKNFGDKDK